MYNLRGSAGTGYWRHLHVDDISVNGFPLAPIATSASASDLYYGVASVNLLPQIPTYKLTGDFLTGAFKSSVSPDFNDVLNLGGPTSNWHTGYINSIIMAINGRISYGPASNLESIVFSKADSTVWVSNASLSVTRAIVASGATLTAPLTLGSNALNTTETIVSQFHRASAIYSRVAETTSLTVDKNLNLGPGVSTSFGASVVPSSNFTVDLGSSSNG
jgi:hypothetical protein